MVIEGQFLLTGQNGFHGNPRSVHGVRSGDRFGQPRSDGQVSDGNNSPSWITACVTIDGQLLKMHPPVTQRGFLTQLPVSSVQDFLTWVIEESTGQSWHALKRIFAPLHEHDTQSPLTQRQDHEVNGQQDGRG